MLLSDEEIEANLESLTGWDKGDGDIVKEYRLGNFRDAVAFVVRLSYEAEAADHHPDLDIRWNRVVVRLSTHSQGGVTEKDLALAAAIELVAPAV